MTERSSGNAFPIQAGASRKMRGAARHAFRFLASGTLALAVNAAILAVLNRGFGFAPFMSRLVAIFIAMVAGWLAHRNITFLLQSPPPFASLSHSQRPALTPAQPNGGLWRNDRVGRQPFKMIFENQPHLPRQNHQAGIPYASCLTLSVY